MTRDEMKQNNKVMMGVGSGDGNYFVEGDYDSIKILQHKLFELEALRRENTLLKAQLELKNTKE